MNDKHKPEMPADGSEPPAKAILNEALAINDPADRVDYLDRACGKDKSLRDEVESLLRAHGNAGDFLKNTMLIPMPELEGVRPGTRIGRYKLLEKIGEGGFGVVWMADQEESVRRRVALKIIKLGMDTKEVVARFEAERQALAMMDHPNIASVFDVGATDTGRPYFVMELVKGVSITDYCDANKLSTRERLELFMQVCHAVQHAHQKGVIHRDLKPNNILVTVKDDQPVPKVIDFGVAKATQARLTEKTMFTQFKQLVGTPAYMSPEQAGLGSLDVDTRSDIYSLGVLLYELLTGHTPFDTRKLLENGYDAVMRTIREDEPLKPSTRLSKLDKAEFVSIAARRGSEPAKLNRLVHGDLDWIVMKALDKDRKHRYETANALADDLTRHLNQEPVDAAAPTIGYRFAKFARRNRAALGTAMALAVMLALGTGASLWQAVRANREARSAEWHQHEAEKSRAVAAEAQNRAEHSAKEVSHELASQYVDKGVQRLDDGDYFGSLVWFVAALRLDEGDPAAAALHRMRIGTVLRECPKLLGVFLPQDGVTAVQFNSDGSRLLTAGGNGTARIWNTYNGKQLTSFTQTAEPFYGAQWSPDGRRVVTASADGTARVWDAESGAPVTPPLRHDATVCYAAFSPDGRRVVTASEDHTARVWDAATGQAITPPLQHEAPVWPATFSPDGRFILTASQDKTARIWDVETGRQATPPLQHAGKVWWAVFSPDGQLVATASEDHTARIWNAHTGMPITPPLQHSEEVVCVAFSPDGLRLVTASGESIVNLLEFRDRPGEARVWEVATGKPLTAPLPHKLSVFFASFSPDGRYVATASHDKTARVWDAKTGAPITPPLKHGGDVIRLGFSPDSRRLATASFDGAARIWDISGQHRVQTDLKDSWLAGVFTFSPDGQRVAGKYLDGGYTCAWNIHSGMPVTLQPHETNLLYVVFSPDGGSVATSDTDHLVNILDAVTGSRMVPTLTNDANVLRMIFSPDGRRLATANENRTARIWDVGNGQPLTPPLYHASNVLCMAFSPDSRRLVTGGEDRTARVWDAATGSAITPLLPHGSGVRLAVFSPDGGRVCTATLNGVVRIWDATTGRPITGSIKHAGHLFMANGVESIAFSPDGRCIVVADSTDKSARVWNAETGEPVTPPLKHAGAVQFATFSHNGKYLVTASEDKTARIWDAATGQAITPPLEHDGPVDCAMFAPDDRSLNTVGHAERNGFVSSWSLEPDKRPANELELLARFYSLHRLDASGAFMQLDFETLTNASFIFY